MKKIGIYSLPLLFVFSLGCVAFLGEKPTNKTEASSYSKSSAPSYIDLNDSTDDDIRSYYSSLNNLSDSEKSGTNLLKNLKPILKKDQLYYSYDSGDNIWKAYEILDRDWEKSPASEINTYNPKTNIIEEYKYNTYSCPDPFVHALYVNRDVLNESHARADHTGQQWGINREHIWAKSCGFEDSSKTGARGDLHHLWASNVRVNTTLHNNYYYGFVDKTKTYTDAGTSYPNLTNNFRGKSKTFPTLTNTVFEPQDSDKGDIARALFYMAARYNYYSGSDPDGIDAGNPNLQIVNLLNWDGGSGYTSTTTNPGEIGILQDLLEWNRLDPPDEFEIHRNNLCYKNFTNNRNPFIDYPEWAEYIWGKATSGKYYPSSTGYAQPLVDTINGFNTVPPVQRNLVSISISGQATELHTADDFDFGGSVIAHYDNGSESNVTSAAVFSGYNMSMPGTYTVKVSYTEGDVTKTTSYQLKVSDKKTGSYTWNLTVSSFDPNPTDALVTWSSHYATMTLNKNDSQTSAMNYLGGLNNRTSTRFYNKQILNIEPMPGYIINSIVFTATTTSDNYAKALYESLWNNASLTLDSNIVTITPKDGKAVVICGLTATTGNVSAKIYYSIDETTTSIRAEVNKDYSVGEMIYSSDITVFDNNDNPITDFTFDNNGYQFKYEDAISGGALTPKTFEESVSSNGMTCSLTVKVKRNQRVTPTKFVDVLTKSSFNATSTSYVLSTNVNKDSIAGINSNAVYTGYTATDNNAIQMTSGNSSYGIVTTKSDVSIHSISVTWYDSKKDRILYVYGKNVPYESPSNLYKSAGDEQGTLIDSIVINDESTHLIEGEYLYIGLRSKENALYIKEIRIQYGEGDEDSATNFANFVMFEDTENQCESKYLLAKSYYSNLSKTQKEEFMTSDDYVISTARERMIMWARHHGESFDENNLIISSSNLSLISDNRNSLLITMLTLIVIGSLIGFTYYYKKECK